MKKIIAAALACLMTAVCLASCQLSEILGSEKDTTTSADTTTAEPADTTEVPTYEPMDFSETDPTPYVTLGNYRGVEVTMTVTKLTDEAYASEVSSLLTSNSYYEQITDRATAEGDTVNVDFKGFMDGEQFQGGTAADQEVPLTENSGYIEGFAEGLVGVMPGETVTLELTFPESYYDDIAGKPVTFEITVNFINGEYVTPEMTDEFVEKYTEGEYKTVAEFDEYYRGVLQAQYEEEAKSAAITDMWQGILEDCEVSEYPEQHVNYYYQLLMSQCESYAANYSMTVDQIMSLMGWTEESLMERAREYTKEDMVFYTIVRAEGFEVSDEEYKEGIARYAESAGADSATLEAYYGKDYLEENLLWDKMLYALYGWANVTRVEA
ncbi:MAG: trigger factor [Clostridia bacterium]|nr:trigger factor [Clostridia bacterium]